MVLGYVEKLSYREDVGTVGMSEIFDPPNVLQQKIEELAMMIQKSKHLVAFTGAGISTSCGIPDFRGPKGVWTLQLPETLGKRGGKRLRLEISTRKHTRNGYLRDFEVETIGMKETSLHCSDLKCRAKLKDTVLDWEGALPPKEMVPAVKHCKMADAVLCLGTRETLKTILFKIVLKLNFGNACGCLCTKIEWPIDF